MTIQDDTHSYETWLAGFTELQRDDLVFKHEQMSAAADAFPFFRGTYYRWLRHWPLICPELGEAPRVLAVGDLHIENFGTWRDREGRLAWGVNDFDEADELPYASDLVRLLCSVRFAREAGAWQVRTGQAGEAILRGYRDTLEQGGRPFVLEEAHPQLRAVAFAQEKDPAQYWKRLEKLLSDPEVELPAEAKAVLVHDLPVKRLKCQFRFRPRVGMGSLGKPRYVALAKWSGSWIAREVKIITPPSSRWLTGPSKPGTTMIPEIVKQAIRCHDPFYRTEKGWVARRLAPRCSRIEMSQLRHTRDRSALLEAMGAETANVHLGSSRAIDAILKDLEQRPEGWLKEAARRMFKMLRGDWKEWKKSFLALRRIR